MKLQADPSRHSDDQTHPELQMDPCMPHNQDLRHLSSSSSSWTLAAASAGPLDKILFFAGR
jgi:hypothetical protein